VRVYLVENHSTFATHGWKLLQAAGLQPEGMAASSDLTSIIESIPRNTYLVEVTGQHFNTRDLLRAARVPVPDYELVRPLLFRFSWGNVYRLSEFLCYPDQIKEWVVDVELERLHPDVTFYYLGSKINYQTRDWRFPVVQINPSPNGIYAAHRLLAAICPTKAFAVVDEDNWLTDVPALPDVIRHTLIYHSRNPYNGLVYGHGGLKVFLRSAFLQQTSIPQNVDMTEYVSPELEVVPQVVSEHRFAVTPYQAWRGAFREASKLLRKTDLDSRARLAVWCQLQGPFPLQKAMHKGALDACRIGDFPINNESELNKLYLEAQR
jgi:hypothetical protein